MNYPLVSEYVEAIKLAEENLEQLSYLRLVLDDGGNPVMSSGNFAVVFKMKDERDGKFYALKCFTREQEGRNEAYKQIADELEFVSSEFIIPIKFFERELFVDTSNSDETEFPVLLMDWVEGVTLDKYVRAHLHGHYALQLICYQFCRVASWLMAQPFAHGDLKPDNILVKDDGSLVMVDYDGMFVPAMKGQKAREVGSPDYRHPLRTVNDFNENIDDFSLATIAMQLYAVALQPELLTTTSGDTLLLCEKDYRDLGKSEMMSKLFSQVGNPEFEKLLAVFLLAHSENTLSKVSFRIFNINKPVKPDVLPINLSTEVTDDDIAHGVKDECGVVYSKDGRRLLKGNRNIQKYRIRSQTQVICNAAFKGCYSLTSLTIPDSVTHIGNVAFEGCKSLSSITLPDSVTHIGDEAFKYCSGLTSITIPDSVTHIGNFAFSGCSGLTSITIPDSVTHIGNFAFYRCYGLTSITLPDSVTHIGFSAFSGCSGLTSIIIPDSVTHISKEAFYNCSGLTSITLPDSVTHIGFSAFSGCESLSSITIPDSVTRIGESAFSRCSGLTSITIPDSVTHIGELAFSGCVMTSLTIPDSVTHIGKGAFYCCYGLTSITLPDSVTHIGEGAFSGCRGLRSITIPDSVTHIGDAAFRDCYSLTSLTIPDSVTHIGNVAFEGCKSLSSITLPDSVTHIGNFAFCNCRALTVINMPNSVTHVGDGIFGGCEKLASIIIPKGSMKRFQKLLRDDIDKLIEQDDWELSLSTDVTEDDLRNAVTDEYGAKYSRDGKKLLSEPFLIDLVDETSKPYHIKDGTIVICDESFDHGYKHSIVIPSSVRYMGKNPFKGHAVNLQCESKHFVIENDLLMTADKTRIIACMSHATNIITIPKSVKNIDENAFFHQYSWYYDHPPYFIRFHNMISNSFRSDYAKIIVPNEEIGRDFVRKGVPEDNIIINGVYVDPYGAIYSSDKTKLLCYPKELKLEEYRVIEGCKELVDDAFNYLPDPDDDGILYIIGNKIITIYLPKSLVRIGSYALQGCTELKKIVVPHENYKTIQHILENYSDYQNSDYQIRNIADFIVPSIS